VGDSRWYRKAYTVVLHVGIHCTLGFLIFFLFIYLFLDGIQEGSQGWNGDFTLRNGGKRNGFMPWAILGRAGRTTSRDSLLYHERAPRTTGLQHDNFKTGPHGCSPHSSTAELRKAPINHSAGTSLAVFDAQGEDAAGWRTRALFLGSWRMLAMIPPTDLTWKRARLRQATSQQAQGTGSKGRLYNGILDASLSYMYYLTFIPRIKRKAWMD